MLEFGMLKREVGIPTWKIRASQEILFMKFTPKVMSPKFIILAWDVKVNAGGMAVKIISSYQ